MIPGEPKEHERFAARAIVRVLDACGDNVEKKERFLAHRLHHLAEIIEDHVETISELRRLLLRKDGRPFKRRR